MKRLVLIAVCAVGCGSPEIGGVAPQTRLAYEHQRAHVATLFAMAKPYETLSSHESDDYNGPVRATPLSEPPAAEQHDAGQDAPAVEWLTLEEAQASGRPYFVFQHYADPALDRGCRPCRVIEKLMRDPDVVAIFTAHGVLTSGTVEDWQKGSPLPVAPAIGYVVPEAKEGDAVPIIKGLDPPRVPTGFRLESKEAFISDIEAWIDKQQ